MFNISMTNALSMLKQRQQLDHCVLECPYLIDDTRHILRILVPPKKAKYTAVIVKNILSLYVLFMFNGLKLIQISLC